MFGLSGFRGYTSFKTAYYSFVISFGLIIVGAIQNQVKAQALENKMECGFQESAESPQYPPIYNEMPSSGNESCYNPNHPCKDKYPFTENWSQVNEVTVRLNIHFIKTGDVGLNFGENDANCPDCGVDYNNQFTAEYVANYLVSELNRTSTQMSDYVQYYEVGDNTRLDPPIPFLDDAGNQVPNLGDTKLRFELYEENDQGSVHIHEIEEYKFENNPNTMEGPCEDGQSGLSKDGFSVYGDDVLDVYIYDEWAPIDGYTNSENQYVSCRLIRGQASIQSSQVDLLNMWYFWRQKNLNSEEENFFIYNYVSTLWHEIGHDFGLSHTFPGSSCCDANERGLLNENDEVFHVTNNTMGYNPHYVTFSPCQLDRMFNYIYENQPDYVELDENIDLTYAKEPLSPPIVVDDPNDVTWDQDQQVNRHIVVKSGNRLNIDAEIRMAPDAFIFVERGAMLHIKAGGKITNYEFNCDQWGGIWVVGNEERNHPDNWDDNFSPDGQDPGRVIISRGAIENARWGINSGIYLWLPKVTGFPMPSFTMLTGGYIYADQATFRKCDQGVRFLPFKKQNKSLFSNCRFLANPGTSDAMQVGVVIDDNVGIEFKGCEFNGMQSHGILMKDAGFNINNGCLFTNINGTAISAFYSGNYIPSDGLIYHIGKWPTAQTPNPPKNEFRFNKLDIRIESLYFLRTHELSITDNTFESNWDPNSPNENQSKNIEIFQSKVNIRDNTFDDTYVNISLKCINIYPTRIVDNDFTNFHTAIWYEELKNPKKEQNSQFACNEFSGNHSSGVLVDGARIINQGTNKIYNNNEWDRDSNDEPIPDVLDIRVEPVGDGNAGDPDPFSISSVFTYSVEEELPPIHPARPLCNMTSSHSNCSSDQDYDLYEKARNNYCDNINGFVDSGDSLSLYEIQVLLDSMDQFGNSAVENESYGDLETRKYRIIMHQVDSLMSLDQHAAADAILSSETDIEYVIHRFGIRLRLEQYDAARTYLNSLSGETIEIADFKTVQNVHLDLLSDTTYEINATDIQTLEAIAEKRHYPSSHARSLLSIIDGRSWDPVFPTVEDTIIIEGLVLSGESTKGNQTQVFPNPSDGIFTIIPNSEKFQKGYEVQFLIYDLTGKQVHKAVIPEFQSESHSLNLNGLSSGIYLLHMWQQGHHETHKIIKQ